MGDRLISLSAAIDAVHKNYDTILDFTSDGKTISYSIEDILSELPSAQPERPKGHWIDTGSGQECSECGEVQYGYDNFRYYCARCGSDNRGKQDE